MLREKTLFYPAQGARWKISTNQAHLLGLFTRHSYTKVTKPHPTIPVIPSI